MSADGIVAAYPLGGDALVRAIFGTYYAATAAVVGAGAAVTNVGSLLNPVASGRAAWVKRIRISVVALAGANAGPFVIHVNRNTDAAAGVALTIPRRSTADLAPVCVARQAPTGTAVAGDFFATAVVASTSFTTPTPSIFNAIEPTQPYDEILLLAGQGVIVTVDTSAGILWSFGAQFLWGEGQGT